MTNSSFNALEAIPTHAAGVETLCPFALTVPDDPSIDGIIWIEGMCVVCFDLRSSRLTLCLHFV